MDPSPKTSVDDMQVKDLRPQKPAPSGLVCDNLSQDSYKDYPVHRPLINSLVHQSPPAQALRASSPCKAFPETNSAAILSALRNLQEKIRKLETEKDQKRISVHDVGKNVTDTSSQSERITVSKNHTNIRHQESNNANCNQVLITHLAAAESRCLKLERQLDHMRKMLRTAKTDKSNHLTQQVMEKTSSSDQHTDTHLEKLDHLEQEYIRLTQTQNNAEIKIRDLELKLQEEEHHRKLVEDKANLLQADLETNRILLRSVSPRISTRQPKDKESGPKVQKPLCHSASTEPHYKLNFRDVPFVAGMSVGCSHSVRANVQSVLFLLKCHQPHLCNSRVLSNKPSSLETCSSSSSSSSLSNYEELSELLHALQEELSLMSLKQDELLRQVERSVSKQERKELQREQERLLLKIEKKGEQISKLYKHKAQIKTLMKEANRVKKNEARVTTKVSTRGRPTTAKLRPGERSKRNLRLLQDMRALQMSLRT